MFHRLRSIILIGALAIIMFVPLLLEIVVQEAEERLTVRADRTPLLLGEQGSSLDLAVNSLYFIAKKPDDISMADARAVDDTDLAYAIPLYTRFHAGAYPIIGTSLEYFEFRKLKIAEGRSLAMLGEAVIGAHVAETEKTGPGDTIISSPENLFDLAGQYPVQMNIVGVLEATGTADDEAIFVDVSTSWIMAGLCHGHEDLAETKDASVILKREENAVVGSPKVRTFAVITPDNMKSFHFHGDTENFPISSAIVVPHDHKSKAILLGRYQEHPENLLLIQPRKVIQELIESIFRIKKILDSVVMAVGCSTVLAIVLVFLLSIRLRAKEIETIFRLGCSRRAIGGFIAAEIVIIVALSALIAAILLSVAQVNIDAVIVKLIV